MAALVVEELLAIGHQVLQVTDLRPIDRRVVDLVQNARGYREPDRAARRVRRPDRVLRALRPSRRDARGAERPLSRPRDLHARSTLRVEASARGLRLRLMIASRLEVALAGVFRRVPWEVVGDTEPRELARGPDVGVRHDQI